MECLSAFNTWWHNRNELLAPSLAFFAFNLLHLLLYLSLLHKPNTHSLSLSLSPPLLQDLHASPASTNLSGRTSLHIASSKGMASTVQLLLASPSGKALLSAESESGWTPVFDACLHGHEAVIGLLVKAGSDLEHLDMLGFTCEK